MRRLGPFLFFITTALFGYQKQAEPESPPFQWLSGSGETTGVRYETHKLKPISLQNETGPSAETEQEIVQVDSQTTRITRRIFNESVNGGRELSQTVVEEIRKMPGDRVHAVRTTSRKDANGRFSAVQREVQDLAPLGAETYQVKNTLLLPGANNSLVEKEQIQQTERRKGDNAVEIDRTHYVTGAGGSWTPVERRVSQNTLGENRSRTEEQVYRYDVNNKLALNQQIKSTEFRDGAGRHLESESYALDLEGKLRLDTRTTILQTPQRDGKQQISETIEKPSPAAPGEGLRLVRKIVENTQVISPKETQKQLEVLEPDLKGGMRTIYSEATVEVK